MDIKLTIHLGHWLIPLTARSLVSNCIPSSAEQRETSILFFSHDFVGSALVLHVPRWMRVFVLYKGKVAEHLGLTGVEQSLVLFIFES